MSTLPVEVTATEPPSPCVQVLGYNLYVGPAHAACYMAVLVCLGPGPGDLRDTITRTEPAAAAGS